MTPQPRFRKSFECFSALALVAIGFRAIKIVPIVGAGSGTHAVASARKAPWCWPAYALLALGHLALSAQAASFDCAKAGNTVERTICADPLLNRLDEVLAENYLAMRTANLGVSARALRAEQAAWLRQRNRCTTRECLVQSYKTRIDETCDYGVVEGVHPPCTMAEDVGLTPNKAP